MSGRSLRRILAVAVLLAVLGAVSFEAMPHGHAGSLEGRGCPACQAARHHVGEAPREAGVLVQPPGLSRTGALEPAVEGAVSPRILPSASPRSPPTISV